MKVALLALLLFDVGCSSSGGQQSRDAAGDGSTIAISCPKDGGASPNKDNGLACACASECKSNFCVDGFCCNSACTGTCVSCNVPTSLGSCTAVPLGVKSTRTKDCTAADPTTCSLDGTCDGTGHCRNYPAGTTCGAGVCNGAEIDQTHVCDGLGDCQSGPTIVCAPYACDPGTNLCRASCASDKDCVAGRTCVNGRCGLQNGGTACKGPGDCASGYCADGVCCDTACTGACVSCNLLGTPGTCLPIPAGQGHPLCARQAPSTCGTAGVCDGAGSCSLYTANTPCGAAVCVDATSGTSTRTCDGLGVCRAAATFSCGNFRCASGACKESCTAATSGTDCADGHICAVGAGMTSGSCGTKSNGQSCGADADCASQHCADGVCCATACGGACQTCAVTGSFGTCTPVATGASDPHGVCKDATAATCGTNGKCDGAGACQKYPAGTTCVAASCSSATYTGPATCNTSGQCIAPAPVSCSPYQCNGTSKCYDSCTLDTQCISPNTCGMNGNISSCGTKPNGQTCSADNQCASQHCAAGGICCNTACTDACGSCNLTGSVGTCSPLAAGTICRKSAGVCDVAETCNGAALTCPPDAYAGAAVVCRPAAGPCDVPETCTGAGVTCTAPDSKAPDGAACSDGNACTQTDSCQAGVCAGANPVACTALDACHVAGTCSAATGACSNPIAANGTACNDANLCTQSDTCQAGVCTGASPVACAPLDACHPGACDPTTGACTNPAAADGTACNDGNACTAGDTCHAGVCTGASPMACAAKDQCHAAGACDPTTGACSNPPVPDGTACDDGNACTTGDTCQAGVCQSGAAVVCNNPCYLLNVCNRTTGCQGLLRKLNGTSCDDGNACTTGDSCQAGVCTGASTAPNGTTCGTTAGSICTSGVCVAP